MMFKKILKGVEDKVWDLCMILLWHLGSFLSYNQVIEPGEILVKDF